MSGCGTRIVLRGQKPLALCDRCPCFGSLFPPLAALTFAASSIICAFGLAAAAPRSPYRHLELCGIALTFIFALKILPRRYPSVAFEEQDERRRRGKTGTFGHIFDQFPLGDQFLRVLQFGLVDLVGKLFAGIDAVKAGQIRRVEAGHAGKGSQGKVLVFHVVLNITVDPLDDGLGAVGFVFLALAAGFGAQVGKAVQHFQLGSGTAAQVGVKQVKAGRIAGGLFSQLFGKNFPPHVQQQGEEQQLLFAVQLGRFGSIKKCCLHHGAYSIRSACAHQLVQLLQQCRKLELVLDGSAAGAQQQIRVSIFVHDQQAAGALVHHAVDAVQQTVLLIWIFNHLSSL